MGRKKKIRQEELHTYTNVSRFTTEHQENPFLRIPQKSKIIVELACGRGDYTIALAKLFPKKAVIGIDRKADRLWHGAKKATEEHIENAYFLQTHIENLEKIIPKHSVSNIWITFPDPHPNKKDSNKRLTSPVFLNMYKKLLIPHGTIHLKTDFYPLISYTRATIKDAKGAIQNDIEDIYAQDDRDPMLNIQTTYEKRHLAEGKTIYYLSFTL